MTTTWRKRVGRANKKPTWLQPLAAQHCRRLLLEPLEERRLLTQVVWGNAAGGDWDTKANWIGGQVPGAGADVVINSLNAGAVVTHSASTTDSVNSITAAAPITLSGAR